MTKSNKIRTFHALLARTGQMEDKPDILAGYGVTSTLDLEPRQLDRLIDILQKRHDLQSNEFNKWRKRVMAAIGAYLRRTGRTENSGMIKAIACRASESSTFNNIPVSKLRGIYSEFTKANKAAKECRLIQAEDIKLTQTMN